MVLTVVDNQWNFKLGVSNVERGGSIAKIKFKGPSMNSWQWMVKESPSFEGQYFRAVGSDLADCGVPAQLPTLVQHGFSSVLCLTQACSMVIWAKASTRSSCGSTTAARSRSK